MAVDDEPINGGPQWHDDRRTLSPWVAFAGALAVCAIGLALWLPDVGSEQARGEMGVALVGGAIVGFAVLWIERLLDSQARKRDEALRAEAERQRRALEVQAERQQLQLWLAAVDTKGADLSGIDLTKCYLRDRNMSKAKFQFATLVHADLTGAILAEADLSHANLRSATLRAADMSRAKVSGADFTAAVLCRAKLIGARSGTLSEHAIFKGADLTDAHLNNAILREADLRETVLAGASLCETQLFAADLRRAQVTLDAKLRGAVLVSATLSAATIDADLTDTDLEGADLSGVTFGPATCLQGTILRNANLSGAKLNEVPQGKDVDLHGATYDDDTVWPQWINAETMGAKKDLRSP